MSIHEDLTTCHARLSHFISHIRKLRAGFAPFAPKPPLVYPVDHQIIGVLARTCQTIL